MGDRNAGRRRAGAEARGGRGLMVWALGLLCGLGAAAVNEALLLPPGLVLAAAGALALAGLGLRQVLRPRPRAVVWEEMSWRAP